MGASSLVELGGCFSEGEYGCVVSGACRPKGCHVFGAVKGGQPPLGLTRCCDMKTPGTSLRHLSGAS